LHLALSDFQEDPFELIALGLDRDNADSVADQVPHQIRNELVAARMVDRELTLGSGFDRKHAATYCNQGNDGF
jgi:hypothetical protein